MKPQSIMVVAGEPSGDLLATELVMAIRAARPESPPIFFGAGGAHLQQAGTELAIDLTQHAVVGGIEALKKVPKLRRILHQLVELAAGRQPDAIICVDFSGFNRRFASAVRGRIAGDPQLQAKWRPRIIQFVSPQVWASRPGRARKMAADVDLLLAIFPFEKQWYAERVPGFPVEFVGHPMVDRYATSAPPTVKSEPPIPLVALLPGSRVGELRRHLPVMLGAARQIEAKMSVEFRMVLPTPDLAELARTLMGEDLSIIQIQVGDLADILQRATIAIASTGTVTLECAWFGVPTVALYKTSWSTYQIGRRIVQVKYLAMPNLLADEVVFPELIQGEATVGNIARAALTLLDDPSRRQAIRARLRTVVASLGAPGASARAAAAVLNCMKQEARPRFGNEPRRGIPIFQ